MTSTNKSKRSIPVVTDIVTFSEISKQYLIDGQLSAQIQVIDCRTSNQYNGWPDDNGCEGHFPGAINIDTHWLDGLNSDQLSQLFVNYNIQKSKPTFLYGNDAASCNKLKLSLAKHGVEQVQVVGQSLTENSEPLICLPNVRQLVSPQWINNVIKGDVTPYPPEHRHTLIEVQSGVAFDYLQSHIPTALNLDLNNLEAAPWWNRVSDENITEVLTKLGICYDTTVILYGRNNMAAARAANIMMYAGVEDVRLLNGGWQAWENSKFDTESLINTNHQYAEFGKKIPVYPHYIVDIPEVKTLLAKDPNKHSLVSIRTWDEFIGKTSGYSYIKQKGSITGSKWGHAGTHANNVNDFINPDGTMKSAGSISALWKDANINRTQQIYFYCGTGWRASEAFFYAFVMGWQHISVFDGGWYEWSHHDTNPIITLCETK
ncbi:sulfurtransferase [Psychromonas sp. PT13]|uniref:sulfurtransferase n=1 Tax=Psychromonas sp. PT13 TaxID=3439547 RepID=UPI003EBC9214